MSDPFLLAGDIALVTGGGTGIGLGIGRCLAARGARVVLAGRREDVLEEAAAEIGHGAQALALDVTDRETLPGAVERIERDIGPIAALVNNAGNHIKVPALEHTDADFDAVLDVHLGGNFALTREIGRRMVERGRGSIVFLSSMNAHIGMPEVPAYSAAKAGITGLVNALSVEWAGSGVRVNAVAPGFIDAGIAKRVLGADQARRERVLARIPVGRLGSADDVGWATAYLCSPAAAYVTGVILPVDGGALIGF
jgi:NAD(P)-dependent dehydrogenase (short-subunit alcohol dehydrogenase family)